MDNRPIAFFDLECYRDYFLCKFKFAADGAYRSYAMWPGSPPLNRIAILLVLQSHTVVGFNSLNYDCPMLSYALSGASNQQLKDANDAIISGGVKPWGDIDTGKLGFYELFNCEWPEHADQIDIMEVLPGVRIGLKNYGGIAHALTIQDLPFDPAASVDALMRVRLDTYCGNDLDLTETCYNTAVKRGWMSLREEINERYHIDVRSKSDAQTAEAMARAKLGRIKPPRYVDGFQFCYQAPPCVGFTTVQLQNVLRIVQTAPYTVRKDASAMEWDDSKQEYIKVKNGIQMPKEIGAIRVKIGDNIYKFGSGGLHSQEKAKNYKATDDWELVDADVGSFYPRILVTNRWFPQQCRDAGGLEWYEEVFNGRMAAKKNGQKGLADSLKIVINGVFGKLGSRYSMFYAPELLIQVTLTGQLMLLMLIEALEANGIQVVSANTDGIVTYCPAALVGTRDSIFSWWQTRIDMLLEYTRYSAIYLRDVNNYCAFTLDGEVKRKGVFTPSGIGSGPSASKAPNRQICADAVIAYLKDGIPIDRTVYYCTDVRKFVTVRNVKGGAITSTNDELGKVVRWIYRRDYEGDIRYKTNGNLVSDSTGAWPMMQLPEGNAVPEWINRSYYIGHAQEMLKTVGVVTK